MALISIKCLVYLIMVLISVAFITLFERKGLSAVGLRQGPTYVGPLGLLQPVSDALKLFTSQVVSPSRASLLYYLAPSWLALFVMLCVWIVSPSFFGGSNLSLSMIFVMICLGGGVYVLMWAGVFSESKYSSLGGMRGLAQSVSYEVMFFLVLLSLLCLVHSYSFMEFSNYKSVFGALFISGLVSWVISMLAETGRTPFDHSEGESELVSGFNTEYSSGPFALFFLGEYGSILFMSTIFSYIFVGSIFLSCFVVVGVVFFFIWSRATLPRLRFDKLMMLAWLILLPLVLVNLILAGVVFYL